MAKRSIKVTVELELTGADQLCLLQNSIERVLNNAIICGEALEGSTGNSYSHRGSTLWQDCEELKPLVVRLWANTSEALRKELNRAL